MKLGPNFLVALTQDVLKSKRKHLRSIGVFGKRLFVRIFDAEALNSLDLQIGAIRLQNNFCWTMHTLLLKV